MVRGETFILGSLFRSVLERNSKAFARALVVTKAPGYRIVNHLYIETSLNYGSTGGILRFRKVSRHDDSRPVDVTPCSPESRKANRLGLLVSRCNFWLNG